MLTLSPRVRLGACAGAPGGSLRGEIRLLYRFSRVRLGAFAGTPRGDLIGEIRFLKPFPLVWFRCVCWRARREFTSWTLFWTTSTSPARHGSGKWNQVYIHTYIYSFCFYELRVFLDDDPTSPAHPGFLCMFIHVCPYIYM